MWVRVNFEGSILCQAKSPEDMETVQKVADGIHVNVPGAEVELVEVSEVHPGPANKPVIQEQASVSMLALPTFEELYGDEEFERIHELQIHDPTTWGTGRLAIVGAGLDDIVNGTHPLDLPDSTVLLLVGLKLLDRETWKVTYEGHLILAGRRTMERLF